MCGSGGEAVTGGTLSIHQPTLCVYSQGTMFIFSSLSPQEGVMILIVWRYLECIVCYVNRSYRIFCSFILLRSSMITDILVCYHPENIIEFLSRL